MITQTYSENGQRRNLKDGFQYENEKARPNKKQKSRREEHVGMNITHKEEHGKKLKRRKILRKARDILRGSVTRGTTQKLKRHETRSVF
jgi:hypothetical protein